MKFLKENKKIVKWVIIAIIILLLMFVVKVFILPMFGGDPYGNRLDGIGEAKINNDSITRMKQELAKDQKVETIDYDLRGRIVNVTIKVKNDVGKDDAKSLAGKVYDYFNASQKAYYDFQIYLLCDNKEAGYPFIGYKHKTSDSFMWTNN